MRRPLIAALLAILVISSFVAGVTASQSDPSLADKLEALKTVAEYGLKGLEKYFDFLLELFQIVLSS